MPATTQMGTSDEQQRAATARPGDRRLPRRRGGMRAGLTGVAVLVGCVLAAGACSSGTVTTSSSGSVPGSGSVAGTAAPQTSSAAGTTPATAAGGSASAPTGSVVAPGTRPRSLNQIMDSIGLPGSVRECVAAKGRENPAIARLVEQESTADPSQFALLREIVPSCIDKASFALVLASSAPMVPTGVDDPPEAAACRAATITAMSDAELDTLFDGTPAMWAKVLQGFDGCRRDRVSTTR